ncbi:Type II secretion system F domain protein [Ammonifex degensii KC4]|uniref:Type II secretion system F domain protein n=1 Tax=Ammonifex degensii (strain DSM 10501 / KC4) TaxID=429009 RepID=C9R936_AMMDK|nr:type II secretion system F family protein [Ammonifex degensii]ACX52815.1 Type II secretion system F domain protein [Ammonifex degensii KC4]
MPQKFYYRARDLSGRLVKGQVEAESASAATAVLRERQLFPVELRPLKEHHLDLRALLRLKAKSRDMAVLTRQFATLLEAGVPLLTSLRVLERQTKNRQLKKCLAEVAAEVQKGRSLAEAFGHHREILPEIFLSMVAVGETSGTLDKALGRLAAYFERQADLTDKLKTATSYPLLVAGVALVTAIALLVLIVPIFADIFRQMNVPLPLPTRIVMGVSYGLVHYWYLILAVLVAGGFGLVHALRTPKGKEWWDRLLLRLPVIGGLIQKSAVARFASTLSTLLATGVPLLQGLAIAGRVLGLSPAVKEVEAMEEGVRRGERLSALMARGSFFPPLAVSMVAVGEESGNLDGLLAKLGDFFEREVEGTVDRFSTLVEPILIIGVGVLVGLIALSIYLPLFSLPGALSTQMPGM